MFEFTELVILYIIHIFCEITVNIKLNKKYNKKEIHATVNMKNYFGEALQMQLNIHMNWLCKEHKSLYKMIFLCISLSAGHFIYKLPTPTRNKIMFPNFEEA